MTDGKKDQLKRKKTLEYELRRLYRAGELTDQQIAELKEAEFPFDAPVRRTAKSVVRIDDGKRWPSCSAAEKRAWDHPGLDVGCVQYGAAGQMGRNQKSVLLF